MLRNIIGLALAILSMAVSVGADDAAPQLRAQGRDQTIVQIGGRHCEYRRSEVEGALRRFDPVEQVDFLNNHGTVLVIYRSGALSPEQLAEAVEKALAMGWGCKAWIERAG